MVEIADREAKKPLKIKLGIVGLVGLVGFIVVLIVFLTTVVNRPKPAIYCPRKTGTNWSACTTKCEAASARANKPGAYNPLAG